MNNKVTVTIAIPAYNEEANIGALLTQIQKQYSKSYKLEKILVMSDGSDDLTDVIVKGVGIDNKKVQLVKSKIRKGKVHQLNKIYKLNKSKYLIVLDGDVSLKDKYVVENVVKHLKAKRHIQVAAIHQIPLRRNTFIGKCIYAGYEFWDKTRLSVEKQNHIQNLYGAATVYNKEFTDKFRFPKDITDDRGYLYLHAKKQNGFAYIMKTHIYYLPVSTVEDFWKLADRSFDKNQKALKRYFGKEVDSEYYIPLKIKIKAIITTLLASPVYGSVALVLNVLTRIIRVEDKLYKKNMWEVAKSTKKSIKIQI
jgi:glycosyltransferase involved in cell wall biosynthesis